MRAVDRRRDRIESLEPNELVRAREVIARQSRLLAELAAEAERTRAEVRAVAETRAMLTLALGHDLRTPLNAVIGFSDVMQRELYGPLGNARYRDYAVHIRESGERLLAAAVRLLGEMPIKPLEHLPETSATSDMAAQQGQSRDMR